MKILRFNFTLLFVLFVQSFYSQSCLENEVYLFIDDNLQETNIEITNEFDEVLFSNTIEEVELFCFADGCYSVCVTSPNTGAVEMQYDNLYFSFSYDGNTCFDFPVNSFCVDAEVNGCTDSQAINYYYMATIDDGLCYYDSDILGCTDILAFNYNALATYDDGSCNYEFICTENSIYLLVEEAGFNMNGTIEIVNELDEVVFTSAIEDAVEPMICIPDGCYEVCITSDTLGYISFGNELDFWSYYFDGSNCFDLPVNTFCPDAEIYGCTDALAINFYYLATIDDGLCYYDSDILGCTDLLAFNYNSLATYDDGSCIYDPNWCAINEFFFSAYGNNYEDSLVITNLDGDYFYSGILDISNEGELCLPDGCYQVCIQSYLPAQEGTIYIAYNDEQYTFDYDSQECFNFSINTTCPDDILGCMDSQAINYNPLATIDDESCEYGNCEALFYVFDIIEDQNTIIIVDQSSGNGTLNYLWDFGDGNVSVEALPVHIYDVSGTYTVCLSVSDDDNCQDTYCLEISYDNGGDIIQGSTSQSENIVGFTINIISSTTISIDETITQNASIFPNPVTDWLNIHGNESFKNCNYQVFDISGKLVLSQIVNNSQAIYKIDVHDLKSGLYTLFIETERGVTQQKFVVNK